MRTLAISSQKGGVGKTTVAVNLAYALARRGWRTLLVDTDPQGGVGASLSRQARSRSGFYDAVVGEGEVEEMILPTGLPELQVLPAGRRETFSRLRGRRGGNGAKPAGVGRSLESLLGVFDREGFEVVIMDTAAGVFGYTSKVLRVSDYVLIPQQAEPLAVRSLPQILELVADMRDEEELDLELAGVVLTMTEADQPLRLGVARELRQLAMSRMLLETEIPRDELFLRASEAGVPVGLLLRNPPAAAVAFDRLAAELEGVMQLRAAGEAEEEKNECTRAVD